MRGCRHLSDWMAKVEGPAVPAANFCVLLGSFSQLYKGLGLPTS